MNFNELATAVYEILVGELDNGSETFFFNYGVHIQYSIPSTSSVHDSSPLPGRH